MSVLLLLMSKTLAITDASPQNWRNFHDQSNSIGHMHTLLLPMSKKLAIIVANFRIVVANWTYAYFLFSNVQEIHLFQEVEL